LRAFLRFLRVRRRRRAGKLEPIMEQRESNGTRAARLRVCVLRGAAAELGDADLLALVLGGPHPEAASRALEWITQTGGLVDLIAGDADVWATLRGGQPARRARLLAAIELGRRYLEAPIKGRAALRSPQEAAACLRARMVDLPHEQFSCVFLDTRHRVICYEPLFRGTIDGATVYPREVLKRALHHNAAAVIVAHNHPSGTSEPSQADRSITCRLKQSLALVDIRLLDHLIVARDGCLSLAERGWL
jgi:DNA repair protein RadC